MGGEARVDPPIKIMIDEKKINSGPTTYEDWYDLGHTIIPCQRGTPEIKSWTSLDLKITKEEWKQKYSDCEIALRLDEVIDFDIDNRIAKRFVDKYIITCGAISGRPSNAKSHYWWKGKLEKAAFSLPKDLIKYYDQFKGKHGATLCEIRSGHQYYTIVPGSLHSKDPEHVKWEHYDGIKEYSGDLNKDLRKIALSTALCILYAPKGSRDEYCTAIAGVLVKQTNWKDDEINDFIYNIAIAANDDEAESRQSKGTTARKAKRIFGMPKIAEIIECEVKTIAHLFSWVGAKDERDPNREKFQSNPECRFLVGTPATGGYGLTLTAANTVIYYSNGYDLEKRLQSEDRAHRIGQKKAVTYVDINAEDTVDEKIVKALRKKINIASEVLGEELKAWI